MSKGFEVFRKAPGTSSGVSTAVASVGVIIVQVVSRLGGYFLGGGEQP